MERCSIGALPLGQHLCWRRWWWMVEAQAKVGRENGKTMRKRILMDPSSSWYDNQILYEGRQGEPGGSLYNSSIICSWCYWTRSLSIIPDYYCNIKERLQECTEGRCHTIRNWELRWANHQKANQHGLKNVHIFQAISVTVCWNMELV